MAISHKKFQLILDSFAVIHLETFTRGVSVVGDDDPEVRF